MFRPLPILTATTIVALAVLIALGTWQLERRAEKHALIEQIEQRAKAAPAPIEILLATGDYAAHRHATAYGTFDHARETYVFHPRADDGPTRLGYKVLTPFDLVSGGTLLVDRGWVDEAHKDPATRMEGQVAGELELEGVLRPASKPRTFTPPPKERTFFLRDAPGIAKTLGLTLKTTLIFEASVKAAGGPEPLPSTIDLPDNHLQYAITWFGFAIVLIVIYFRLHMVQGRLRFTR